MSIWLQVLDLISYIELCIQYLSHYTLFGFEGPILLLVP
jgi:hypothetical protein